MSSFGWGFVTDVRCVVDESPCEIAIFASRASLISEVTLCASRACKRPPCGATSGFYFTATSIMHNLSTSSHATPIEFTHIDYHLVQDPSQKSKTVVGLGSRILSLALDTTLLAPENPRTKYDWGLSSHKFLAIRRKACFSGVHSTLPPFPCLQPPNWKRPSCTQKTTATCAPNVGEFRMMSGQISTAQWQSVSFSGYLTTRPNLRHTCELNMSE